MRLSFRPTPQRPPHFLAAHPGAQRLIAFEGVLILAGNDNKIEDKILREGSYEPENLALCKMLVRPGDVCVDVGANIGVYTVVLASLCGASGEVHAFEPVDHVRRKLWRNLYVNGVRNAHVNPCALGEKLATVGMNQVKEGEYRAGTSTLTMNENIVRMGPAKFERREVAMTTLDAYVVDRALTRLAFVKVDVEGYEINVLAGAEHTLTTLRPAVLMEHIQKRLQHLQIDEARFAELFARVRYECFELVRQGDQAYLVPYAFDRKMLGLSLLALPLSE